MRRKNELSDLIIETEQLAQLLDVLPRQVTRLTNDGTIKRTSEGRYKLLSNNIAYIRSLRAQTRRDFSVENENTKLRNERLSVESQMAALKLRQIKGELIDASHVDREVMNVLSAVKNHMRALPSRIASLLEGKTRVEIRAIMKKYVDLTLREASEFDTAQLRSSTNGGGNGQYAHTRRVAKRKARERK